MLSCAIDGVAVLELRRQKDRRGSLVTVFGGPEHETSPEQWNLVTSLPGTLRGVHVHSGYDERYVPLSGRMFLHLHDARRASPSFGRSASLWVDDHAPVAIEVPAGVAHAVAFPEGGKLLFALSARWTGTGEFGCRWDDEELGVPWPIERPTLSDRDASAGSYADMVVALDAAMAAPARP